MIILTAAVGAIAAFLAVYIISDRYKQEHGMRAIILRRLQKFKDHTLPVKEKAPRRTSLALSDIPFLERTLIPMLRTIQEKLIKFAPTDIPAILENRIMLAGKSGKWSLNYCVAAWVLSIIICALLAMFIIRNSELIFIQKILFMVLGAIIGAILPFMVLNNMIQKRQKTILKQLPEFLDMLCVSVQAGLSFEGAVSKIAARMKGPLIDEFNHMQRDGQMGIPRRISLQQMAKRCDIEEIYLFTASIIQSERLGTSMANTLENQANNVRDRHRQYVKAQALKAPVKIIFPLVIFIVPPIFVFALLPIVFNMIKNFSS